MCGLRSMKCLGRAAERERPRTGSASLTSLAFIWHELDVLGETRNLFFCLGAQFAGPLSFQEFFQDTVAEWEKKTGRTVRIQLATSKDITDAILADPVRARQVAVIDMRYWQY